MRAIDKFRINHMVDPQAWCRRQSGDCQAALWELSLGPQGPGRPRHRQSGKPDRRGNLGHVFVFGLG